MSPNAKMGAAFSMEDFAAALEEESFDFNKGRVIQGKVFEYAPDGVYVDVGGKSPAFLPLAEISLTPVEDVRELLPLDEERDFLIVRGQDDDGQLTLSLVKLEAKYAWDEILKEGSDRLFDIQVSGTNRGGVTVVWKCLRGFIPRSHLLQRHDLESLVGQEMTVSLLEANPEARKLVFSQRDAVRASNFSQLNVGELVEGTVTSIKPFGVFVDLSGITGLLHIKQVSQNYVESLTNVFQIGQSVRVVVMNLDAETNRVSLSTKVLENYPGEMLQEMAKVMETAATRVENAKKKV